MMQKQLSLILFLIICTSFFKEHKENSSVRPNKDFALFFAIEDYDEWQNLRNPISDATSIAQELEINYGFQTEVIKNPTRADIYEKLDEYRNRTYAADAQLMVFFTGHGEFTEATKEGFFIPKDGQLNDPYQDSYIPHTRLERSINSIPCKHILLALDACFSGTFDELIALNKSDDRPGANINQRQDFIERTLKYKSRLYITSGGKERTPDQSQFAKQLLAALRGFGGKDNIVSFSELVTSLQAAKPLPKNGQFGDNEIGGNFLFILNNKNNSPIISKDNVNRRADLAAWETAERGDEISTYQAYLEKYPNGIFALKANENIQLLEDKMDWKIAQRLDSESSYQDYINRYPSGQFITQARSKIQALINDFSGQRGKFTDSRDGQIYKWIRMKDEKIWMAENLNYKTTNSYCYKDEKSNCHQYGRLYAWSAAKESCPVGWRLPSDDDWWNMMEYYGKARSREKGIYGGKAGKQVYGKLIRDGGSGFAALFGGNFYNDNNDNTFHFLKNNGFYWSASERDPDSSYHYDFSSGDRRVIRYAYDKKGGLSCRCIKDLSD